MITSIVRKGLLTVVFIMLPALALAHTALKTSTPADGAMVAIAPAKIDLQFSGAVRLIRIEISANGKALDTAFTPAADPIATYSIDTPDMVDGNYTVNWAAIGADGHTVTNSFSFTVDSSVAASDAQ